MNTTITNNTIDSNTLMGFNFQLNSIEDYHLVTDLLDTIELNNNNAWVNSNDFITFNAINPSLNKIQNNLTGYYVQLSSNIIRTSNTVTALTSNVISINSEVVASEYIDVFSNGLFVSNTEWIFNDNNTIQLKDSSIDENTTIYISLFVENNLNKLDKDLIIDNSLKLFSKEYNIQEPNYSLNFEKIESSNAIIYNVQNSNTTTINNSGFVDNVDINTPRRYYNPTNRQSLGILVIDNINNLANLSEDFSYFTTSHSLENTNIVSPNNIASTTKFIATGAGTKYLYRNIPNLTVGNTYCISIWAKQEDIGRLAISTNVSLNATSIYDTVNLVAYENTGQSLLNSGLEKYVNDWYRCWHAFTSDRTSINLQIGVNSSSSSNIFIYGLQINDNIYPEIYIPTQENTINITKDNCFIDVSTKLNDKDITVYSKAYKISNTSSITSLFINSDAFGIDNNTNLNTSYKTIISIDKNYNYSKITNNSNVTSTDSLSTVNPINLIKLGGQESIILQEFNSWNNSLSNTDIYTLT